MRPNTSKYLQITAYVMLGFIFVFVISIARDCSNFPNIAKEGKSGGDTLDIALIYGPTSYYTYADTMGGINMDIALRFNEDTGNPIKLWPVTDPLSGLEKLKNGTYDIIASLPLDNVLKNNFQVSESVFLDRLVLVQLSDSINKKSVSSSLDLNGKKVYVTAGSSAVTRLKNLSDEIGGKIEIEELPDMSDELLCLKVATGTIPLAVVNEKVAQSLGETYSNLNYDNSVSFTQFQVWVFNPSDSLVLQKFDRWFNKFKESESYHNILNKY